MMIRQRVRLYRPVNQIIFDVHKGYLLNNKILLSMKTSFLKLFYLNLSQETDGNYCGQKNKNEY